jgi:ADP-ribosylglycohydrolase
MSHQVNTDLPHEKIEAHLRGDFTQPQEPLSFIDLQNMHSANKRVGGMIGLLVGDAVGVPYEFHSPEEIPEKSLIEMTPPASFHRSHKQVPVGTWSDDGAQALCLFSSITKHNKVQLEDFSQRLCDWYEDGYMAVDSIVFDVGIQTSTAIDRLRRGVAPHRSGSVDEASNGNGSLMRVLPLALYGQSDDIALVKDAHIQSLPTHAHPRSLVACAYYCLVTRAYLNEEPTPWELAATRLESIYTVWDNEHERSTLLNELQLILNSPLRDKPAGSGYVVDTLWSAKRAMDESNYEDVIKAAIAMGKDTDTTACVAGGLAGIRFGFSGIPSRWLMQLRGFEVLQPYLINF